MPFPATINNGKPITGVSLPIDPYQLSSITCTYLSFACSLTNAHRWLQKFKRGLVLDLSMALGTTMPYNLTPTPP